jgi:aerobic C4-dicarboxylate transport protein
MERRADTRRAHWYSALYVQVLAGILAGVAVGYLAPRAGEALKPLGDAFLKMIKMVIGLVIFCTVVSGMGGMSDLKKVGRVGGKALIYFEVVSMLTSKGASGIAGAGFIALVGTLSVVPASAPLAGVPGGAESCAPRV